MRRVRTNIGFATPAGLMLFCCVLFSQRREAEDEAEDEEVRKNIGFAKPAGLTFFTAFQLDAIFKFYAHVSV